MWKVILDPPAGSDDPDGHPVIVGDVEAGSPAEAASKASTLIQGHRPRADQDARVRITGENGQRAHDSPPTVDEFETGGVAETPQVVSMTRTPKRPRDTNQLAKMVVDIATGEQVEQKRTVSVPGNSSGGRNRARSLSAAERSEVARKEATARWKKDHPAPEKTK